MLRPRIKQRVIDRGWGRVMQNLEDLDRLYTKVGLPEEGKIAAGNTRKEGDPPVMEDMGKLVLIGIYNEFGVEERNQPPRPWLRGSYDEYFKDLKKVRNKLYLQVVTGRIDAWTAIARLGEWMTNKTKKYIKDLKYPENAPSTVRIKTKGGKRGSISNPLIHFAQMINSIQHVEIRK